MGLYTKCEYADSIMEMQNSAVQGSDELAVLKSEASRCDCAS